MDEEVKNQDEAVLSPEEGGEGSPAEQADEKQNKKEKKGKKDKAEKKEKKPRYPFWKRLLIFLLGFLIGIVGCVGGIAGAGFWAFSSLSLKSLGVTLPEEMQGTGEVDLSTYTAQQLLADVMYYSGNTERLTLGELEKRYGLKILKDVKALLPEELIEFPLTSVGEEDGMDQLLSAVDFGFIFGLLEEGLLPPALESALQDKDLSLVMDGNVSELLRGVKLGYLLSLDYEERDGEWVLVYADPANPTAPELLADIDVGELVAATEEGGDVLLPVKNALHGVTLGELSGDAENALLSGIVISDAIVLNPQTGKHELQMDAVLGTMKIGSVAGYEKIAGRWQDKNGAAAPAIMAGLLDYSVADLTEGQLDMAEVMGDLQIGDVIGYEKNSAGQFTDGGVPLSGINRTVAALYLSDVLGGDLDIAEVLGEEKVGVLMNYTLSGKDWFDQNGEKVTGMNASLANIVLSDIFDGTVSIDGVLGDVYLGEVMGYTVSAYKPDGVTPKSWVTKDGHKVEGINETVANMKAGALTDGSFDYKDAFGDQMVGELQGYTRQGSQWYKDSAKKYPLGTLDNAIANLNVGDLIDGKLDLSDAFGSEKVGHLQGYTFANGQWYKDKAATRPVSSLENLVAGWKLGDLMNGTLNFADALGDASVADLLGYKKVGGIWKDQNGVEVDQLLALLAETKVSELGDRVHSWHLGDLMGYHREGGKWVNKNGEYNDLMGHMAELKLTDVSDLSVIHGMIDDLSMADVLNYEKRDGKWYHGATEVTGVIAHLADCRVADLASHANEMTVADVFGYRQVGGAWVDKNGAPLSPLMASLAPSRISKLDSRMAEVSVGDIFAADSSGFFSLIGHETRMEDLDDRVAQIFDPENGATIGDFMEAGIIRSVSAAEDAKLSLILGANWKDMSMTGFVNSLIGAVASF